MITLKAYLGATIPVKRNFFWIFGSMALIVASVTTFTWADDFVDVFRAGQQAEDSGSVDQALTYYSDAVKMAPQSARAWAKRGEAYLKKGEPRSAIKDLTHAIKLDPAYAPAFVRLGFAYNAVNEYARAVEALDAAIRLEPTSSEA